MDISAVLLRAGLSIDALSSPDCRIPASSVPKLLAAASEAAACPHLALIVGERWRLYDERGFLLQRVRCSSTVGEALEALTLFQRLNSQGGAAYLTRYADSATMGFAVFQPEVDDVAAICELALSAHVSIIREIVRSNEWAPSEVHLPRAHPADEAPYHQFFRCRLHFNAEQACFRFPSKILSLAMENPEPDRARLIEAEAMRQFDEGLLPRLYRSLRLLLLDGAVTGNGVAAHLALHRRTLDRRLHALGTSFQAVLDEVRYDIALHLLAETHLPVANIASSVGFSESSSFVRAFRQWSGTTPMKWRAAHQSLS